MKKNKAAEISINSCPSINGQFARYRRCAKNLILAISTICLRLNFSRALISTKFAYFWMDTNSDWCKGCGICVAFCPKQVLALNRKDKSEAVRTEDCIACMLCELRCPDLAIEVITFQPQAEIAS